MAGFREFLTGEVLSAANVNNFLMKQSVMVFADASARTAALGAEVVEGMLTYNEDTAQLEVYDGAAFVPAAPAPPAQKILQVVTATDVTNRSTTSTSFVSASLSASITPTAASNLIIATWASYTRSNRTEDRTGMSTRILADAVAITGAEGNDRRIRYQINVAPFQLDISSVTRGIYTTVGTSSVSFTTEFRSSFGETASLVNASATGVMTLMEVSP